MLGKRWGQPSLAVVVGHYPLWLDLPTPGLVTKHANSSTSSPRLPNFARSCFQVAYSTVLARHNGCSSRHKSIPAFAIRAPKLAYENPIRPSCEIHSWCSSSEARPSQPPCQLQNRLSSPPRPFRNPEHTAPPSLRLAHASNWAFSSRGPRSSYSRQ